MSFYVALLYFLWGRLIVDVILLTFFWVMCLCDLCSKAKVLQTRVSTPRQITIWPQRIEYSPAFNRCSPLIKQSDISFEIKDLLELAIVLSSRIVRTYLTTCMCWIALQICKGQRSFWVLGGFWPRLLCNVHVNFRYRLPLNDLRLSLYLVCLCSFICRRNI